MSLNGHTSSMLAVNKLVVDLDGTLLRSDMLYESFWSAVSCDWTNIFSTAHALAHGKASMKRHLMGRSHIDVTTLPYNETVIEHIRLFRDCGGRTMLVTASDQALAETVAGHLGLFDEVHGSDGKTNLKGAKKASFLNSRYGKGQYAYMGDSHADLHVWKEAGHACTVNASPRLRAAVEDLNDKVEHLTSAPHAAQEYLRALRPHQWAKNLLVFVPMLAAHDLAIGTFVASLIAFIAFCMVASSVYVFNDLLDLASDRAHPRKRHRPFAAGRIPLAHGTWMGVGLFLGGALISLALSWPFFLVMMGYFVLTIAYSLVFKRRVIIDICILAALYTARIIAGGAATGIPISVWMLAFSTFLFFSLAAVKRQAELVDSAKRGRLDASGRGYLVDDLPIISMMALGAGFVSVLVLALYLNSTAVQDLYTFPQALWGICFVLLYWLSRMVLVAHRGNMHDDPIVYAGQNKVSRLCLLLIFGFVLAATLL